MSKAKRKFNTDLSVSGKTLTVGLLVLLMTSCSSYQAPVTDDGDRLPQTSAQIISSGGASSSSGIIDNSAALGSTGPVSRTGRAANAGDTRATGAPATNTNAVSIIAPAAPRGISRAGIERNTIADAAGQAGPDNAAGPTVHRVSRGETLYSIAWQYGVDYRRLALANNLQPPYTIYPDQRLNLDQLGFSDNAISAVPTIPASPAGETNTAAGQRAQAAFENRRRTSVPNREVAGVSWEWPGSGRVLTAFGSTGGRGRGVDIQAREGDPVYAAAAGEVVFAGRSIQGAGELVIIRHSASLLSAYMHNSSLLVSEGMRVQAGDMIASSGRNDNGEPVLHFEVRRDGVPVNPLSYLPAR
ncbi:MAG: peptidoglycan DD-metalloendopeptidase family protein [Pseudomonadales bacterium]|nr:peptidoglycan DD-metalloendopeptidase family protein [Pseudomonadales bacterium]